MPRYLLDTNIVSDLIKNPQGPISTKIAQVGESEIATSIIVAAELRFGAMKRGSVGLTEQVEAVLGSINILPLQPPVDQYYGQIRVELEAQGLIIGSNDLFIAAHAMSLSAILVTGNVDEFARVHGLMVENWLG